MKKKRLVPSVMAVSFGFVIFIYPLLAENRCRVK